MKASKRFKTQERQRQTQSDREKERDQICKVKSLRNRNKKIVSRNDAPFESNINTVVEKHLIRNYTS